MQINLDESDLAPIIERTVAATLERLEADRAKLGGHLALAEPDAAAAIGVARHVLRDARLRGEIKGSRIGKRVVYRRDELLEFLERNRA